MPPQQGYALLDFIDDRFDLGPHASYIQISFGALIAPREART